MTRFCIVVGSQSVLLANTISEALEQRRWLKRVSGLTKKARIFWRADEKPDRPVTFHELVALALEEVSISARASEHRAQRRASDRTVAAVPAPRQ